MFGGPSAPWAEGPVTRRCMLYLDLFVKMTRVISLQFPNTRTAFPPLSVLFLMQWLHVSGWICIINIYCPAVLSADNQQTISQALFPFGGGKYCPISSYQGGVTGCRLGNRCTTTSILLHSMIPQFEGAVKINRSID